MPLPAPWEKGGHVSGSLGLMHCSQPTSQTPSQRQQHLKPMELGVSPYACSLHHFPCQDVLKMWVQQQLACSGIIRIWHKHGDMWYISILSEKKNLFHHLPPTEESAWISTSILLTQSIQEIRNSLWFTHAITWWEIKALTQRDWHTNPWLSTSISSGYAVADSSHKP